MNGKNVLNQQMTQMNLQLKENFDKQVYILFFSIEHERKFFFVFKENFLHLQKKLNQYQQVLVKLQH